MFPARPLGLTPGSGPPRRSRLLGRHRPTPTAFRLTGHLEEPDNRTTDSLLENAGAVLTEHSGARNDSHERRRILPSCDSGEP
jgi:hypothetical protein